MRKPPVEHKVRAHERSNAPHVHSYHRGHRKPPKETHKLIGLRSITTDKPSGFEVDITYVDGDTYKTSVKGTEYRIALSKGLGLANRQVRSIMLIRNS